MIPEMVINTKNKQRRSNIHLIDTLRKSIKSTEQKNMPRYNRRKSA